MGCTEFKLTEQSEVSLAPAPRWCQQQVSRNRCSRIWQQSGRTDTSPTWTAWRSRCQLCPSQRRWGRALKWKDGWTQSEPHMIDYVQIQGNPTFRPCSTTLTHPKQTFVFHHHSCHQQSQWRCNQGSQWVNRYGHWHPCTLPHHSNRHNHLCLHIHYKPK